MKALVWHGKEDVRCGAGLRSRNRTSARRHPEGHEWCNLRLWSASLPQLHSDNAARAALLPRATERILACHWGRQSPAGWHADRVAPARSRLGHGNGIAAACAGRRTVLNIQELRRALRETAGSLAEQGYRACVSLAKW